MTFRVTGIAVLDSAVADVGDLRRGAFSHSDQIERARISGSSPAHLHRGVTA
jgi:hypothetical protein